MLEKVAVETTIKKAEGMFNKKAIAEASSKFNEYAGEAERVISELQQTADSQAKQILNLNKAGEEAAAKLKEAQAKIAYQQAETDSVKQALEDTQNVADKTKQKLRQALNKKFNKKEELPEGQIKTTISKARTGFQAEVIEKPGSSEVTIEATLGDGATKKSMVYDKATKKLTTVNPTEANVVGTETGVEKGKKFVKKIYSDGTSEVCYPNGEPGYSHSSGYHVIKYAKDGKTILSHSSISEDGLAKFNEIRLGKDHFMYENEISGITTKYEHIRDDVNSSYIKMKEVTETNTGRAIKYKRELDEFGIVKPDVEVQLTCPKNSEGISGVLHAKEINNNRGYYNYQDAIIDMKDGSTVKFDEFRGRFYPNRMVTIDTKGKETINANSRSVQETWARLGWANQL